MLTIYLYCYKPPLGLQLNSKVCNLHIYLSFLTLCTQDVAHFCAVYPYLLLPAPLEQVACLSTQACIYPFPAPLTLSMLYTHISTSPHIISYSTLIINVRYLDIIIHPLTRDRKWTSAVKSLTYENVCPALLHMYTQGA